MQQTARRDHFYRHSGLTIRSQLELPEWEAFRLDHHPAETDVEIVFEDAVPMLANDQARSHFDGDTLSFTVDGIARFGISGGSAIRIAAFPGAQESELRLFTLGSAWAGLGYQRGFAMLHGSAVAIGSGAVMFCGDMEAGKSTMAAAMVARGHALVSDDLARVDPPAGPGQAAMIHPSAPRLKLWREAIDLLGWNDRIMARDHFRDEKFHLRPMGGSQADPVPLQAVVLLEWGEGPCLERLEGSSAVRGTIASACYRPEMLEALSLHPRQASLVAGIVAVTPVYRLVRPRDFDALGRCCELIELALPAGK